MRGSSCFRKEIDILIDAHMHVFDIQQLSLSPKKLRYVPEKSASFEEYHSLAEPRGITGCLVVQPSFLGTHNGYISQFLNAEKEIFGVAVVEPRISFPELKSLSHRGYRGIRWNLVQQSEEALDFSGPVFRNLWNYLNELDMHVELHVEGYRLMKVLEQISPRVNKIVVDHFMRPYEGFPGTFRKVPDLYRDVKHYVDLEKIWVKASGAYRVFPDLPHAEAVRYCSDLAAMLAVMLQDHRILWGSDWPCTQNEAKIEGATPQEKYATLRETREIWSRKGVFFDPDKAFESLIQRVGAESACR